MTEENVLKITVGTLGQFEEETLKDLEKIRGGGEGSDKIIFEDPTIFRKVLTERRQELIQEVMERPPESIRELAETLGRGLREVYEDVHLMEDYRILTLEKEGNRKKPRIPYDRIRIMVDLPLEREAERAPALS